MESVSGLFFCILFVSFVLFLMESLCSLGYSLSLYVDHYGLKLRDPPASAGVKDMCLRAQAHGIPD